MKAQKKTKERWEVPWKEQTVEEARKEFVERVKSKEASLSALCREYGISRPTGYAWLKRYESGQMGNKSHARHTETTGQRQRLRR